MGRVFMIGLIVVRVISQGSLEIGLFYYYLFYDNLEHKLVDRNIFSVRCRFLLTNLFLLL
jgi:hypothetical protein